MMEILTDPQKNKLYRTNKRARGAKCEIHVDVMSARKMNKLPVCIFTPETGAQEKDHQNWLEWL